MTRTNTREGVLAFIRNPPRINNLSDRPLDVHERDTAGLTPLHVAVRKYALGAVKKLLACGADAHAMDPQGRTALRIAHFTMYAPVIMYLVFHDALVRALATRLGRPPTQEDVVRATLYRKMSGFRNDVRKHVVSLSSQLVDAARAGALATVQTIVESGEISIDTVDPTTQETPFAAALVRGRLDVCRYLMASGADVNSACLSLESDGRSRAGGGWSGQFCSTLVAAVRTRNVQFVRDVVREGGALLTHDIHDGCGGTCALSDAVSIGDVAMVDALVDLGVRFVRWQSGLVVPNKSIDGYELLSSLQLDTTRSGNDKGDFWYLLCMACWWQQPDLVTHLLETPADLFQDFKKDIVAASNAAVALFLAVYQQNKDIVTLLLTRGASVNQLFGCGLCAMVAALVVDSSDMLSFLLEHGGDVFAKVTVSPLVSTQSLLTTAVHFKAIACVRMLLPMETRRLQREQALQQAVIDGNTELVSLFSGVDNNADDRYLLRFPVHALQQCVGSSGCALQ